jgi:hypothetical protein
VVVAAIAFVDVDAVDLDTKELFEAGDDGDQAGTPVRRRRTESRDSLLDRVAK